MRARSLARSRALACAREPEIAQRDNLRCTPPRGMNERDPRIFSSRSGRDAERRRRKRRKGGERRRAKDRAEGRARARVRSRESSVFFYGNLKRSVRPR